jgi:hypothetical protein
VQVALGEQFLLDAGFDAFAKERAVGQHNRAASAVFDQVHDEDEEQVGGFAGADGGGEILLDAILLHAAERRVGDDDIHAVFRAVIAERSGEGVVVADLAGHFDAVQEHVGGAEQMRQGLLLHAVDGGLQDFLVSRRFHALLADVFDGAGEEAARATRGIEDALAELGIDRMSTMNWVTARGV